MAYIGKTPSQATRSRFYYTATGGETSLSGADDNGNTLVFSDGNYVDVMLNGVTLVADTDYNTTTANTIGGLTALTASDIVEIVVYDTFSVFGGDVKGDFNVQNGTLTAETVTASGLVTAQDGLVVDNDGATVATFDRATSDGTIAEFQKDGSAVGSIGTQSGQTYLASPSSGIRFTTANMMPVNGSGTFTDDTLTIGADTERFKDLYLSGGVYLGGTGAANYLDDYEEGTWTPTAFTITYATASGTYTKIGNICIAHYFVEFPSTSDTSVARVRSLPFTVANLDAQYGAGHIGLNSTGFTVTPFANRNTTEILLRNESNADYVNSNFSSGVISGTVIYRIA